MNPPVTDAVLRVFAPRLPRGEHIELSWRVSNYADEYEVRAFYFKTRADGHINVPTQRYAVASVSPREIRLAAGDRGAMVDVLRSAVRYVVDLVRPDPLPPFRIRTRGARRLRAA